MRLYIAEKKDVATAIAEALGCNGRPSGAAYHVGNDRVTWLWGHLLKLSDPEDHNAAYKKWELTSLPMDWPVSYFPEPRHKEHLKAVIALAKEADEIVNAGDPDPEGQRLVDEVLEYGQLTHKSIKRILINDNNAPAILKAIEQIEDNQKYYGLSMSALARAVCDQRYGYNLTRCYTLLGRNKGYDGVLSVGRVQTPILGLVVARDRAHEAHEKQAYYVVQALMDVESKALTTQATYIPKDTDPVDDKKRLIDAAFADQVVETVKGKDATIISVETVDKKRPAPLPYNLLALQADAAGKWKYSPKKVLEITQALRDQHKAITYNRSDCRYLNEERHSEAGELFIALAHQYGELANNAQTSIKSKAFNSSKVTAHHAIIPTLSVPDLKRLSEEERNIYDLIARSYLAQFYPPETYRATTVLFECEGYPFKATGRVDVAPGWTVLYAKDGGHTSEEEPGDNDTRVNLESLTTDDPAFVKEAHSQQKFTQPLPRYTMKTLLKDLTRVSKYVTNPEIKALLLDKDADKQDEAGGIGTPATRDSHIDTLFTRGYMEEQGKALVSTALGREFHDALPEFAVKPDLTALWHEKQQQIEAGELDYQTLIAEVDQAIVDEIERVKGEGLNITVKDAHECPTCKQGVLKKRKGKKGAFWGCNRYPECNSTFPDKQGQPDFEARKISTEHACPRCENGFLQKRQGKQGAFWSCHQYPDCKTTFPDSNGKPDQTPKAKIDISDEHQCPKCQKPMARRPSKKKPGNFWWSCTGYPDCKNIAFDNNGVPDFK